MSRWSALIDVDDGVEADYTIHQLVSYLRGAYKYRDYEKVERLLTKREERIRAELEDEVEKSKRGGKTKEETEVEMVKRGSAVEIGELRKVIESLEVKHSEAVLLKLMAEESLTKVERECEDLREQNLRLRGGEKRAVEMCEKLKQRMMEMEEDAKERVKKLELEFEVEERLRKKAEADLQVLKTKFKELELMVLNKQKDIDLLTSLGAGSRRTEMGVEKNPHSAAEDKMQAPVRAPSDQFSGGSAIPSVKTVEKTAMEGANPVILVSAANTKQSDPLGTVSDDSSVEREKQTNEDGFPRNKLGQLRAKHGLGSCIEILSSDDEDDPSELLLTSKDKSDFCPMKLEFRSKSSPESDHEAPEVSSGFKRKHIPRVTEDRTETVPEPTIGKGTLPRLLTPEGKKVRPSNESQIPLPSENGTQKSLNSGEPKEIGRGRESRDDDDDDPWKKALLEKLHKVWDEVTSESSSEDGYSEVS